MSTNVATNIVICLVRIASQIEQLLAEILEYSPAKSNPMYRI